MPYPESCPECGSTFRNTGTHFTARRNEIGRHVLLELGCQNTTRRFWWDFTTGNLTEDGRPTAARRESLSETVGASSFALHPETNGHARASTLDVPDALQPVSSLQNSSADVESFMPQGFITVEASAPMIDDAALIESSSVVDGLSPVVEQGGEPQTAPPAVLLGGLADHDLAAAFVRQLQLDRLMLRQMRSWLTSEDARRSIEVAAGATEATYERLALILFGTELPQLLGKPATLPQNAAASAEERLELQREKARIRARVRRAAAKAAEASEK